MQHIQVAALAFTLAQVSIDGQGCDALAQQGHLRLLQIAVEHLRAVDQLLYAVRVALVQRDSQALRTPFSLRLSSSGALL